MLDRSTIHKQEKNFVVTYYPNFPDKLQPHEKKTSLSNPHASAICKNRGGSMPNPAVNFMGWTKYAVELKNPAFAI
jgi:hypothetical protein